MIDFGNRQFGPTLDTQFGEKYTGTVIIPTTIVRAMIEAMPDANNTGCIQMVIYKEEGVEIDIPYKPTREVDEVNSGAMDTQTTQAPPQPPGGISSYLIKPGVLYTYKYTEAQGKNMQQFVTLVDKPKYENSMKIQYEYSYKLNVPGNYITYGDITYDNNQIGRPGNIAIDTEYFETTEQQINYLKGGLASSFYNGNGVKTVFVTSIVNKDFYYNYLNRYKENESILRNYLRNITDPITNATSHMIIHKPVDGTYVNYTLPDNNQSITPKGSINFSSVQAGLDDQIGTMDNGVWKPKEEGVYFVLSRATNEGSGGSIQIKKSDETVVGTGYKTGSGLNATGATTITTFGLVTLKTNDNIAVYSLSGMELKPITVADKLSYGDSPFDTRLAFNIDVSKTCNFMIQKVDPNNIVSYILDNSKDFVLKADEVIPFTIKQLENEDKLGTMLADGKWKCNAAGQYLIFADVTNVNGGDAVIKISVLYDAGKNTEIIGTGYATNYGTQTALTMGYANLSVGDIVYAQTLRNSRTLTKVTVNSCHLLIYKVV
jgi:hypothetical protein